uniref:Uncharacterized protein n=1 Tax=Anguilla anguilla TaxID=7936 RepID=A0A0E9W586_ANGAN
MTPLYRELVLKRCLGLASIYEQFRTTTTTTETIS